MNSPLVDLAHAIEKFPEYAFGFILALIVAMLTDPIITVLTVGVAILGVLTNALTAIAVFALVYVVIRTINTVANAIGVSGQEVVKSPLFQSPMMVDTRDLMNAMVLKGDHNRSDA